METQEECAKSVQSDQLSNHFTSDSGVSIIEFEQVNASWEHKFNRLSLILAQLEKFIETTSPLYRALKIFLRTSCNVARKCS